jgi:indoleamine 2,3-dioxygenase
MIELLDDVTSAIKGIKTILLNMYVGCKPEVFWTNVRIYLSGYTKDNGLPNGLGVTGTNLKFNFVGGSAAQSTLIQTFDIFLGVEHKSEHGRKFLLDQRTYMPQKHQNFLSDLASIYEKKTLKLIVTEYNDKVVLNHYNMAVDALMEFRSSHYKLVHNYVIKFIKNPDFNTNNIYEEKGSGGLPTEQLKEFIDDTDRTKLYSFWHHWKQLIWPDLFLFILLIVVSINFRTPESKYQDPWNNREYFI